MDSSPGTVRSELPTDLRALLQTVRQQLRRYSVQSGMLGLIIAASAAFWATTGLDSGWFALQRLEIPVALRAAMLAVMLCGGGWLLLRNVVLPLLRRVHDRDLALLLERRFPDYQDRLITAVEGAEGLPVNGPLSSDMLARTISDADQLSRDRNPADVFDQQPLRRRSWLAGLLLLSVAGTAAAAPETLPRWWNAFIRCEETYHTRTTHLDVTVIQQPGDRRLSFQEQQGPPLYRHPRGNDLELELTVPDGNSPLGQPWVVPDRVRVDVRRGDGTTSRTYVSANSDRTFRYVITRLQENVEIELLAGDFRIPQPLLIRSVDPPRLDEISLHCNYPEYTRWNELRNQDIVVSGSDASLPIGTQFHLAAHTSKPLQAVRIVSDDFELSGNQEASSLLIHHQTSAVTGPGLLSADGRLISIDLQLIAAPEPLASESAVDEPVNNEQQTEPPDPDAGPADRAGTRQDGRLLITPGTTLKFFLHDADDIMSGRPLLFRVQGIEDRPPVIDVRAEGIDSAITRRAVIPFTGTIRDDYGLRAVGFEFVVDSETRWRPRPFSTTLRTDSTEFVVGRKRQASADAPQPELFQVQPLDLTEGQTLSIALTATDGCETGEPNTARSDPGIFRVVSDDELLSLLYTREINLRRRFEAALRALEEVRDDLTFHEQVARRLENADTETQPEDQTGLTTCATQSGNTLRRQVNELRSILEGFRGIIRQLINNAIPLAQSDAMKNNIVKPLQAVIDTDLPAADRALSRFRVAATSGQPAVSLVTDSEQQVGQVISQLKQILEHVRNMAEFHEALSDLRAVQEEQKRIQRDTKKLKRRQLIDEL